MRTSHPSAHRSMHPWSALVLLFALAATSCDGGITGPGSPSARRTIDVDVVALQVDVLYGGAPIGQAGVSNPCFSILLDGVGAPGVCGSQTITGLVAGTHTVELTTRLDFYTTLTAAGPVTVTIATGQTAVQALDVAGTMGILEGAVTINGQPDPAGQYVLCVDSGCHGLHAADGSFRLLLPAGAGTAAVRSNSTGAQLGSFPYTVQAGQTTAAGSTDVQTAALQVDVLYNGAPVGQSGVSNSCFSILLDGVGAPGVCSSQTILGLVAGTHTLELTTRLDMYTPLTAAGPVTVTLAAGQTTVQAMDVAGTMGILEGAVTVNGQPDPSGQYVLCVDSGCHGLHAADGSFRLLLPAGAGTAAFRSNSTGAQLGSFAYTVQAGQTTTAGSVDVQTAALQVDVLYNGAPVGQSGATNPCFSILLDGVGAPGVCSSQTILGLVAGTHTLELTTRLDMYTPLTAAGPVTVTLAAGQTTVQALDVAGTMGVLTGRVTVNGQPASSGQVYLCVDAGCFAQFAPDGTFQLLLPAGAWTGAIRSATTGVTLATFGYTIQAGETTFVGTVEGGAAGYTPTGTNVEVAPVASNGTTPVTLNFAFVNTAGTTALVPSGSGPPPPGTYTGDPPLYYDITTSAVYTGSVRVCINYLDAGVADESLLSLYHGDGAGGWTDVTISRDPVANVICGLVTSLSPFLVAERNQAPVVGALLVHDPVVRVGGTVRVAAPFTDANGTSGHTAWVDWGDGTSSAASVAEAGGAGTLAASHVYATAGVYTITASVSDGSLTGVAEGAVGRAVVYDPEGGRVTGGGWIASPAEACGRRRCGAGRATFAVNARYAPGASVPSAGVEFHLHDTGLRFAGAGYEWLVVSGGRAYLRGSGRVNGSGGYVFLLTVRDGGPAGDRFRLRIREVATGAIVYDNAPGADEWADAGTTLGGGSIAIHP